MDVLHLDLIYRFGAEASAGAADFGIEGTLPGYRGGSYIPGGVRALEPSGEASSSAQAWQMKGSGFKVGFGLGVEVGFEFIDFIRTIRDDFEVK